MTAPYHLRDAHKKLPGRLRRVEPYSILRPEPSMIIDSSLTAWVRRRTLTDENATYQDRPSVVQNALSWLVQLLRWQPMNPEFLRPRS